MPLDTINAMHSILTKESSDMKNIFQDSSIENNFRTHASGLISAKKDEVAFVTSTTNGINLFASAVKWKRGDNIILGEIEYPSNIYPWLRIAEKKGLEIRKIRPRNGILRMEDYEKAIDDRTKVLPISYVQFSNGQRMNLKHLSEICNEHGTMLFLDAIQALGAVSLNVRSYDIAGISAGGYKWLCGPLGSGLLYVSNSFRDQLDPEMISWFGLEKKQQASTWNKIVIGGNLIDDSIKLSQNASVFNHSIENYVELVGLTESIKFLRKIGLKNIERRIFNLTDYFIERLDEGKINLITPREHENRAGILTFSFWNKDLTKKQADKIEKGFGKIKLVVRMNAIRSATHIFNSKEDIDTAMNAILKASRRFVR